jgi:hypothetical protein
MHIVRDACAHCQAAEPRHRYTFFKSRNRMRDCYNSNSASRIFCKGWRPKLLVISGTKSRVAADSVACVLRRAAWAGVLVR